MKAGRRGGILWVTRDNTAPHPYLVEACRRAGGEVRELRWAEEFDGQRPMGRFVELGRRTGRTHPMSFKLVSPRLLARFARAAEDVVIIYELGLVGFYAGLSKLVRRRGLISLVEGYYRHLGRTGTAGAKVALRRLAARSVDLFIANNPARDYLIETLKVPRSRIVAGWWLAGLPAGLPARMPAGVAGTGRSAAVRLRRPADRAPGHRPADRGGRHPPARNRALHPVDHRRWPGARAPGRTGSPARGGGLGDFSRHGRPRRAQGRAGGVRCASVPTLQDLVGRVVVEAPRWGCRWCSRHDRRGRHGGARRRQRADRGPARPARAGQSAGALCRAANPAGAARRRAPQWRHAGARRGRRADPARGGAGARAAGTPAGSAA